jgi:hypothetical protein
MRIALKRSAEYLRENVENCTDLVEQLRRKDENDVNLAKDLKVTALHGSHYHEKCREAVCQTVPKELDIQFKTV